MAGNTSKPIEAVTTIGGRRVPYRILISQRARRLRLTISSGEVSVTLPKGVHHGEAEKMLQQNSAWLLKHLERAGKPRPAAKTLPPDVILLRGEVKKVVVIEEPDRRERVKVDESTDRLVLRVPPGAGKSGRSLAVPWLKARAREEIAAATSKWAARMGVNYRTITIRDQKTRWGSCSTSGTLSFNWRLVMAPPSILDYVVIHELAHLKQPNHSPAFWQVVAQFYPDYKKARAWLRGNTSLVRPPDLV